MHVYLGLGSNLGDRRQCLDAGLAALERTGARVGRVSAVVESPALLPDEAPPDWNRPYLNLVAECSCDRGPDWLLDRLKAIERELGRQDQARWAPRPIDIDILLWGHEQIDGPRLTVPHPRLLERGFALSPLVALKPSLTIPGRGDRTVLDWSAELDHQIPLWMGIVNLTPDSFSDGNRLCGWPAVDAHVREMIDAGVHIVDLGAESTRPGAEPLSADAEWARLEPVLGRLAAELGQAPLGPTISVDTYHAEVARRAIEAGAGIINDVSGLSADGMLELAADSRVDWIAMHQLSVPADPAKTLPADADPVAEVERWLEQRLRTWSNAGLDLDRIVFDPGIGFGKNALQSLKLLRSAHRFRRHGVRTLIGHSRKSFMRTFAAGDNATRDLGTVGASLDLIERGVDILRVHNVAAHAHAYRGWAHLR
jgi:2-amino-4-hydroxy-6-hydroxymethyldihydropteridine diphosphokinase / dihydropteroate synthase